MTDREGQPDPEPSDLDTSKEPEPEWAEAIRRGRRERAERVREQLGAPDEDPEETAK